MAERHATGRLIATPGTFVRHDDGTFTGRAVRNGMPAGKPYARSTADAQRDAEVDAQLAAIKAEAARRAGAPDTGGGPGPEWYSELAAEARDDVPAMPPRKPPTVPVTAPEPEPEWCGKCGYKTTSAGHLNECGMPP